MAEDRIRAGVIGLGDIATKAYLPVLATRADVQLRLCTRDRHMLDAVAARFRVEHRYVDVADLVAAGLDAAFVHVATVAHVEIVGRLLDAGVPTYVDKPLASDLVACSELVERAASRDCSLLVGFNRRHAPIYRELRDTATSLVFMQKNRVGLADAPRHVVFDDFVHVVDTLRFLAPQAELTNVQCVRDGPNLDALVVFLVGGGTTAIGAMNRNGGHTQEIVETHGVGRRRVVHDMATLDDYRDGAHVVVRRGDWTPVHVQRGFDAICAYFLDSVRSGQVLDASDALRTHEMCERIVAEVEGSSK